MSNSAEELRGLLKKIREDIGRMPRRALPAAPTSVPSPVEEPVEPRTPVRSANFNEEDADEPTFYAGSAEPSRLTGEKRPLPVISSTFARGRFFQALWQAVSLAAAAAGAFAGNHVLLAAGLLSFSASVLAGYFVSANPAAVGDYFFALGEVVRKVDGLERRVASISFSAESGGVSKELEEEIHELRRILMSLMKSLETPQEQPAQREREEGE